MDVIRRALFVADAPAPTGQYNGLATIKAATYSACLEDAWQTIPTLSLTFGLPGDKPVFNNVPPLKCLDGVAPNGTVVPDAAISGPAAGAAVNTIDPNFKNPKYFKSMNRSVSSTWTLCAAE